MSWFSSERPHLRPLLTCGVRMGAKSTDEKKPLEKTPVEKHLFLGDATPCGVGVLSNGFHFAWFPHLAGQIINTTFAVVSTILKKLVRGVCSHQNNDDALASIARQQGDAHQHGWGLPCKDGTVAAAPQSPCVLVAEDGFAPSIFWL